MDREEPSSSTGAATRLGTDALFSRYVDVVNRAIAHNQDGIYGKAIRLWESFLRPSGADLRPSGAEKIVDRRQIAVGIYQGDASEPHHWYTVELRDGRFDVVAPGKHEAALDWKISEDHLEHVVHDPQKYIDSPVKLDLDWLATRVGLS